MTSRPLRPAIGGGGVIVFRLYVCRIEMFHERFVACAYRLRFRYRFGAVRRLVREYIESITNQTKKTKIRFESAERHESNARAVRRWRARRPRANCSRSAARLRWRSMSSSSSIAALAATSLPTTSQRRHDTTRTTTTSGRRSIGQGE
jgi:hypothetical protein